MGWKKKEPVEEAEEDFDDTEAEEVQIKKAVGKPPKQVQHVQVEEPIWSVQHVAVQTEPVVYNSATQKSLTLHEAVVEILNRIEDY